MIKGLVRWFFQLAFFAPVIARILIEKKTRREKLPGIAPVEVGRVVARTLTAVKPMAHAQVGPGARKMKNLARLHVGLRDWMLAKALYSRRAV